ncbi:MAG: hypothetical protein AAGI30_04405 [Planctomycetota bacterium]
MKLTMHAGVLVLLGSSTPAHADLFFEFDQANYEVLPGQTVDVRVLLSQVGPIDADPADLTVDGLFSGGVRVFFNITPPSDPAVVASLDDITPNRAFDDTLLGEELFLDPGQSAALIDSIDDIFAPLTGTNILLGTFRFTAGDVVGEVTNLRADDVVGGTFTENVSGGADFAALDDFIAPGFATITVVPAPGACVLACLGGLTLGARRRRLSRERP